MKKSHEHCWKSLSVLHDTHGDYGGIPVTLRGIYWCTECREVKQFLFKRNTTVFSNPNGKPLTK